MTDQQRLARVCMAISLVGLGASAPVTTIGTLLSEAGIPPGCIWETMLVSEAAAAIVDAARLAGIL